VWIILNLFPQPSCMRSWYHNKTIILRVRCILKSPDFWGTHHHEYHFLFIKLHYLNHLRFKFNLIQKIGWNAINWLNKANKYKNIPNFKMDYYMLYVESRKYLKGRKWKNLFLPSAKEKHLAKRLFASGKNCTLQTYLFTECFSCSTRQRGCLPIAWRIALGKAGFHSDGIKHKSCETILELKHLTCWKPLLQIIQGHMHMCHYLHVPSSELYIAIACY
jgi:hypothetical protein